MTRIEWERATMRAIAGRDIPSVFTPSDVAIACNDRDGIGEAHAAVWSLYCAGVLADVPAHGVPGQAVRRMAGFELADGGRERWEQREAARAA